MPYPSTLHEKFPRTQISCNEGEETQVWVRVKEHWGPYATGLQNDEKISRKTVNAQSRATFFRHSAVLLHQSQISSWSEANANGFWFLLLQWDST